MDFAIRKDAREWFRDIRADMKLDFDAYYFCFMAGVSATPGRKKDAAGGDVAALVDTFPGAYSGRGRVMVALFLAKELDYLGVALQEKHAVHQAIARLVDTDAANHLSAEGVSEFNRYAHGGFEVLLEWFEDRPRALDTFLRTFYQR